jgi:hypothetical protein
MACGFGFASRLLSVSGNSRDIYVEGMREPCPRCGAEVVTGPTVYDSVATEVGDLLVSRRVSRDELLAFESRLREATRSRRPARAVDDALRAAKPELRSLVDLVPGATTYEKVMLLIQLIATIAGLVGGAAGVAALAREQSPPEVHVHVDEAGLPPDATGTSGPTPGGPTRF